APPPRARGERRSRASGVRPGRPEAGWTASGALPRPGRTPSPRVPSPPRTARSHDHRGGLFAARRRWLLTSAWEIPFGSGVRRVDDGVEVEVDSAIRVRLDEEHRVDEARDAVVGRTEGGRDAAEVEHAIHALELDVLTLLEVDQEPHVDPVQLVGAFVVDE